MSSSGGKRDAESPTASGLSRYRTLRLLGEGTEKRVFLARDQLLDCDVALALLKAADFDATTLERFVREARAMGRLRNHPHVVSVFDAGEEAGQLYLVTQHMEGGSLDERLAAADGGRLPVGDAIRIAEDVCRALEHAHARGVIHRDVKPTNVFLSADGRAKLGDFGLAVLTDRPRFTQEGTMVGTMLYAAPEQALGNPPDARSDLYALGAVLFEMLTGRPPFVGDDPVSVISQHISAPAVAPSWYNRDVPRLLDLLVLQLLAKDPHARPESAARAAETLGAIARAMAEGDAGPGRTAPNPLDRLASGVFVGREGEMRRLRHALNGAFSGSGQVVTLVGEAGLGKTRLAEELSTLARLRGARPLWGRASETEGAPAYWPWIQILRTFIDECDPAELEAELRPWAAHVAQLVPEIRRRLPDVPEITDSPGGDPESARFRLFDAITRFLREASRATPLVLVLDDLHWADKPSLLLLQFLARLLDGSRLLIVACYREGEQRAGLGGSEVLGEIAAIRATERLVLAGMTERDVAQLIELSVGVPAAPALVAAVHRETEGNAFFLCEVVRLLVSRYGADALREDRSLRIAIPPTVRDVLLHRLDALGDGCRQVLRMASAIGRDFHLNVLSRVSRLGAGRVLAAMDEALAARVLVETREVSGQYRFAHGLVRETLYETLPLADRTETHARVARAIEALHRSQLDAHLSELAYHFAAAVPKRGAAVKAAEYALRAGRNAARQLAYEEAAREYENADRALEQAGRPRPALRCAALLALGDVLWRAGDMPRARSTFLGAVELARRAGLREELARAVLGFGGSGYAGVWETTGVVDPHQVALLEEALDRLPAEDSPLRARLLGRLAIALYWSDSATRREALSRTAVEAARRLGDRSALADALSARHLALWGPENLDFRLAASEEIVELAEEAHDHALAERGRLWLLTGLLERGAVDRADALIETYGRLAQELKEPQYIWRSSMLTAMRALMRGDLARAETLAFEGAAIGAEMREANAAQAFALQIGGIRREQGRLAEVEDAIDSMVRKFPGVAAWRICRALMHQDLGRSERARAEFDAVTSAGFDAMIPRDYLWLSCICGLAELAAAFGDEARAHGLYERLQPYAGRVVVVGDAVLCLGAASASLALLAATMRRPREAEAHFRSALELEARIGMPLATAHTAIDYAAFLSRSAGSERHREVTSLCDEALKTARAGASPRLARRAEAVRAQVASGRPVFG